MSSRVRGKLAKRIYSLHRKRERVEYNENKLGKAWRSVKNEDDTQTEISFRAAYVEGGCSAGIWAGEVVARLILI